ncbi:MAG: Asp-tRNA(Asn)/Glu-tRNA(Gln) amidotransferase GatCAB subunit A, partial [Ramlibacter sp.]|nr:Asp-tRNA(Asn)/Glu-tRNA(Gln) amidotransferase GatCAB subunit A [Cryobacterium sp.]
SLPMGLAPEDGLPVGLQIMAPAKQDARLYQVGAAIEAMLEASWGHTLLSQAPELAPGEMSTSTAFTDTEGAI